MAKHHLDSGLYEHLFCIFSAEKYKRDFGAIYSLFQTMTDQEFIHILGEVIDLIAQHIDDLDDAGRKVLQHRLMTRDAAFNVSEQAKRARRPTSMLGTIETAVNCRMPLSKPDYIEGLRKILGISDPSLASY